jgi:hypothetical protein
MSKKKKQMLKKKKQVNRNPSAVSWFGEEEQYNKRVKVRPMSNSVNFLGNVRPNPNTSFLVRPKSNNSNSKLNINTKPFSFLGIKTTTSKKAIQTHVSKKAIRTNKSMPISRTNFFGLGDKQQSSINPSPFLFRKESIKKKRLSKWGDFDMDGSPDGFDCDPRNPFKDYIIDKNGNRPQINDALVKEALINDAKITEERNKNFAQDTLNEVGKQERENKKIGAGATLLEDEALRTAAFTGKTPEQQRVEAARTAEKESKRAEKELGRLAKETLREETKSKNKSIRDTIVAAGGGIRGVLREKIKSKGQREYGALDTSIKTAKEQGRKTSLVGELKGAFGKGKTRFPQEVEAEKNVFKLEDYKNTLAETVKLKSIPIEERTEEQQQAINAIPGVEKSIKESEGAIEKHAAAKGSFQMMKQALETSGPAGTYKLKKYIVDQKLAQGKTPTAKQTAALVKAEQKLRWFGKEGKLERLRQVTPGGTSVGVFTGAAVGKGGEYTKATRAKAQKMKRMVSRAAGAFFGPALTQDRFDSEPRGRGRPAGPSGEYKIGGRPAYEEEFQQYASKQRALNRMLPSGQQSQTLNPEYIAYMKAQKAAERGETQTVMTEDGMPMEGIPQADQTEGYPTTGSSMMQTGQQQIQMKEKRAYNRATPDEIKIAQAQAQSMDNPLSAPNFMKGELKATGGSILTPIGPSILDAPQVFKGEMRNVTQQDPNQGEIKMSERPQTNPYSNTYLEIELGSGKPVLRTRPSEKWATGEAL